MAQNGQTRFLEVFYRRLRERHYCGLSPGVQGEELGDGWIRLWRGAHPGYHFFHQASDELFTNLELMGLIRPCDLGCTKYCRLHQ